MDERNPKERQQAEGRRTEPRREADQGQLGAGMYRSTAKPPSRALLTHRRLLGGRLHIYARVRFVAAALLILVAVIDAVSPGLTAIPARVLGLLAVFVAGYNAVFFRRVRGYRSPELSAGANRFLQQLAYGTIVLDYLVITVVVWLTGGARSPFMAFYLLHLIVSHLLISPRRALWCLFLAFALVCGLVLGEWSGAIPMWAVPGQVGEVIPLGLGQAVLLLCSYALLFGAASVLLRGVTRGLRERELRLHAANRELARLSTMRRQFLHIALHNLQSPLGAVRMMLRNMKRGLMGPITEQQKEWMDRGIRRIDSLGSFLHDLQTMSELDEGKLATLASDVHLEPMLEELVGEHQDLAEHKHQTLVLRLNGEMPTVRGVERLLREAVANYLTNALKYTPSGGSISVGASFDGSEICIEVVDDGVGISDEDQDRLFKEFMRVGHAHPEVAHTQGSGLGLSIVKRIVDAHGGKVWCRSVLHQGSTFGINLPLEGPE